MIDDNWTTIPHTQGPLRRCRIGNVLIELENDREWRLMFEVMPAGKSARSWFGCRATGSEDEVKARAEAVVRALDVLRGEAP